MQRIIGSRLPLALVLAVLGVVTPATAFHRVTPPVTSITTSGDTNLPRVPSQGRRSLVLAEGGQIAMYMPFSPGSGRTVLSSAGSEPAVSLSGRMIAWRGADGRIALAFNGNQGPGVADPSGTSDRPSLDKAGTTLAFDSAGGLGLGAAGVRRVYVRDRSGILKLVSMGSGTSQKAMLSAKAGIVAFESTSNPTTGVDTGISQIWVARLSTLPATRITAGAAASTDPRVSDDGRIVVFASRANLAGNGADTGVTQIFAYDRVTRTFAQITNDASGCSRPAVLRAQSDWRIAFVCGGQAYFHMLRANERAHVPTPDGTVQAINAGMGDHFVTVSTTADLSAGSGTTTGNRIYLLNLYANPPPSGPGSAVWFPFQGIPSR